MLERDDLARRVGILSGKTSAASDGGLNKLVAIRKGKTERM